MPKEYAARNGAGRPTGATRPQQAYDRGMTETRTDAAAEAPEGLSTLLGTLNLLGDDAAGLCSGGFCRIPGLDAQDAPKPE